MIRLLVSLAMVAAFIFGGGNALAQSARDFPFQAQAKVQIDVIHARARVLESRANVERCRPIPNFLVGTDQFGNAIGMLPTVGSLPSVNLPAMPADGVRPQRPAVPPAPPTARRPQVQSVPHQPQVPKAPEANEPRNYPRGEVVSDLAKRLYLDGQPVGEIRARKGRLKGELVNVDQNALHIDIWPGNYLSRIAVPVDRGQYKIAYATGKGWVFLPEKTNKIPAGCKPVQIGD